MALARGLARTRIAFLVKKRRTNRTDSGMNRTGSARNRCESRRKRRDPGENVTHAKNLTPTHTKKIR